MSLEERVQKMLDGESKRREIALQWVEEVESILLPVAKDIWGVDVNNVEVLTKVKNDKKENTCIYFRYKRYVSGDTEEVGFYDSTNCMMLLWGEPLEKLRGKDFWYAIQVIMNWIPQVIECMDKKEESREKLINKLK